ncbi:hypothetical protein ABKN59_005130 [Abortiporus biennis]
MDYHQPAAAPSSSTVYMRLGEVLKSSSRPSGCKLELSNSVTPAGTPCIQETSEVNENNQVYVDNIYAYH